MAWEPMQSNPTQIQSQGFGLDRTPLQIDDPGSIQKSGEEASTSSAPPYQPILGGPASQQTQNAANQQIANATYPNPPDTEKFTYKPITEQPGEQLTTSKLNEDVRTPVSTATASTVNPNQNVPGATSYQADKVQDEFNQVMNSGSMGPDGVPDWARNAVTAARQQMNASGLGNSTMAAGATTAAILQTALPMAMQNASFENASRQFNAQSEQQNNQFIASMTAQIQAQNADRETAISQFNAGQENAAEQFKENLTNQRQQFNIENQRIVDQSNVQWRRTINTANTAGANAAAAANVQNLFNMSQQAQNNVWQEARDEASAALAASENAKNRQLALVSGALNRATALQVLDAQQQASMFSSLGSFGVNLLGGLLGGTGSGASAIGSGIKNLLGGSSSGGSSSDIGSVTPITSGGIYGDYSSGFDQFGVGSDFNFKDGGLVGTQNGVKLNNE